jgi:phytoene dehydrogenase-like protein
MQKKVVIIGAGISGLSAGCYALKSGFEVEILEKNTYAGGLCRSLPNSNFIEDGFPPLIQGMSPYTNRYNLWKELSIENHLNLIAQDFITAVYQEDRNFFYLSSDLVSLRESFLDLSPNDTSIITSFFEDLKELSELRISTFLLRRSILSFIKLKKLQIQYKMPPWKYALQFRSSLLADIFSKALSVNDQSLFSTMQTLVSFHTKNCSIPSCRSSQMVKYLENEFKNRGGKISFTSPVTKILIEKNKDCGVLLENGDKVMSDAVVSCADGYTTLFEWIDKKYLTFPLKEIYKKLEPYPPLLLIRIVLKGDFSKTFPWRFILSYPQGKHIVTSKIDTLSAEIYSLDNTISPSDKSILSIKIPTIWSIWKEWEKDEKLYRKKKTKIIENVIQAIDEKFPQLSQDIISSQISTPIDFYRSSGNFQGSYHGFMSKEKKPVIEIPQNLTFLKYFYMAGHWTIQGGGIYAAVKSARNAIKMLCRESHIPFKT